MRPSLSLLIITAWAIVPLARAQTAASQPEVRPPTATQPAGTHPAATPERRAAHPARGLPGRHSPSRPAADAAKRKATAGGVLALGATDITGNKELPKVMAIVPWKDSLGASGVVKPTDSLMDEVLAPVDRGVFQRQIRYYQQLDGNGQTTPAPAPGGAGRKP